MTSQARNETNLVDGVSLEASATRVDPRSWRVDIRVENGGTSTIYLYDRLWNIDHGKVVKSAEPCYRFERNGALRLIFGVSPLPRKYSTTYRNVPHTTMLEPGQSKAHAITLTSPVDEHSAYFVLPSRDAEGKLTHVVAQMVNAVEVGMHCLADRPDLKRRPAVDQDAVDFEGPVALLQHVKLLRAKVAVEGLVVNRRTDYFERFTWPGEPVEPM